jgi:hypothetical protein
VKFAHGEACSVNKSQFEALLMAKGLSYKQLGSTCLDDLLKMPAFSRCVCSRILSDRSPRFADALFLSAWFQFSVGVVAGELRFGVCSKGKRLSQLGTVLRMSQLLQ